MFPVRCYTCNHIVASLYDKYIQDVRNNVPPDVIFKKLRINRYCCKRMFLSYVTIYDYDL